MNTLESENSSAEDAITIKDADGLGTSSACSVEGSDFYA